MEHVSPERLVANRYVLQATQRRGRAGVVWRATDLAAGGVVAVEEIEPPAEPEAERAARWSRIVEGARTAALIDHPGALTLHDVLLDGDRLYVVTELVEALGLDELLERHGRLPPRRVAGIGLDVLDVLEAVHRAGFTHLDLQPASVLVTTDGAAHLAGLGLAAVAPPARPAPVPAPEQVRGAPVGPPADLWALGATMYTAVAGAPPFGGGSVPAAGAVLYDEPRPCQHAGPLAPVIEALLAKAPERRPAASEVRRQLQEVAERTAATGVVGRAARTSPGPLPGWRQALAGLLEPRRRGLLVGASSVLLALLSFVLIVAVIGNPTGSGTGQRAQVEATVLATSTSASTSTSSSTTTTTTTTTPPATAPALPAGWTVFGDERVGYRIAYPASWEVVRNGDHQAEFHDRSLPTFLRVEWQDGPAGDPLAAEQQSSQQHADRHEDGYQQVRVEPAVFQGRPGALLEFTYLGDDQEPFRAVELGGDTPPGPGGRGHWVSISIFAREADWGVAQAILQTALGSFVPPPA
jgi:serine/threonine protein kinase